MNAARSIDVAISSVHVCLSVRDTVIVSDDYKYCLNCFTA